jgi:hypothetical protein
MKICIAALVAVAAICGQISVAQSATIAWGPAHTESADTDVITAGSLVRAYTFETGNTTTVNGVTFTPWEGNAAGDTLTGMDGGSFGGYGPFTGQSAAYDALTTGSYYSNGATATFTFNHLTVGTTYEVETWENDARGCCDDGNRNVTLDGQTTLAFNVGGGVGDPGQFAIGLFTATSTSQAISFAANESAQVNGIELRSVPEPTSLVALGGLGVVGLFMAVRRRRKT